MELKNFAVMSFDGVHLLLPQPGVAVIEVAKSIGNEVNVAGSAGTLSSGGREWPVFALTADFETRLECPPSYKYCVGFDRDDREAFSIACEEVSTLSIDDIDQLKAVHTCMRTSDCPIESLLLKDSNLMLISEIETMHRFLVTEVEASEVAEA